MHKLYPTRKTYAHNYRVSAPRSQGGVYYTEAGEGIMRQTCSGEQEGFDESIAVRMRADGSLVYFVESEKFADRYYFLYQKPDKSWIFSGDSKLIERYVAKVEAFRAEHTDELVDEKEEECTTISPSIHSAANGFTVYVTNKQMTELHAQVLAAMSEEERAAYLKEKAFEKVWHEVREIEQRGRVRVPGSKKREAMAS